MAKFGAAKGVEEPAVLGYFVPDDMFGSVIPSSTAPIEKHFKLAASAWKQLYIIKFLQNWVTGNRAARGRDLAWRRFSPWSSSS